MDLEDKGTLRDVAPDTPKAEQTVIGGDAGAKRPRLEHDSLLVYLLSKKISGWDRPSAYNWFIERVARRLRGASIHPLDIRRSLAWAGELYVLTFLCVVVVCWLLAGLNAIVDVCIAILLSWRAVEILLVQVRIPLVDIKAPGHGLVSVSRSVLLALINLLQVALIFAALDHIITPTGFYDPTKGPAFTPHSPWGFLYLSWTTMLTLGSGYEIATPAAKALVMAEVGTGLLLIAMSLAAFVGAIRLRELDKSAQAD